MQLLAEFKKILYMGFISSKRVQNQKWKQQSRKKEILLREQKLYVIKMRLYIPCHPQLQMFVLQLTFSRYKFVIV